MSKSAIIANAIKLNTISIGATEMHTTATQINSTKHKINAYCIAVMKESYHERNMYGWLTAYFIKERARTNSSIRAKCKLIAAINLHKMTTSN